MMQLPTNAIYQLLLGGKIFNSDQNVLDFFSHIHVWNCEAKIFPTFYYLYTGIIWVTENLESYVIYEFHFQAWKAMKFNFWSWEVMENLTSVW